MSSLNLADCRVLVTGGAGFLGRVVCRLLEERGCTQVTVPRRRVCDLTDQRATSRLFAACAPDIVLHLAAEVGGIGANMRTPGRFTYANLTMGANVVEAARVFGCKKMVAVGTVCSYPLAPQRIPFLEEDLWSGYPEPTNAGYGVAKRAIYELLMQYNIQYGMEAAVVIPTNLYGLGDNYDPMTSHVIPAMIRKFMDGTSPVSLWGTGAASREFLHVEDAAEGIVRAAELVSTPDPINLGGGGEITMRELAEMIAKLCQYDGEIVWDSRKPGGQPRRSVDSSRAKSLLGWTPRISLEQGCAEIVAQRMTSDSEVNSRM